MAGIGGLSLQIYVEGMAKADIGPINADQQKTDEEISYHQETPQGTSCRPSSQKWFGQSQSLWRTHLARKI